jgi:hypothetical protein
MATRAGRMSTICRAVGIRANTSTRRASAMEQTSLKDFDGTLVLVGAGKMGGAMLE